MENAPPSIFDLRSPATHPFPKRSVSTNMEAHLPDMPKDIYQTSITTQAFSTQYDEECVNYFSSHET